MSKRDTMECEIRSHTLFHNHPAESIAYCVGLIYDLEGRSGQVRRGTSQLGKKIRLAWTHEVPIRSLGSARRLRF